MRMIHAPVRIAVCAVALFATAWPFAQQTGTIRGTVTDSSGAVTPGVTITVDSPAMSRAVVSDRTGAYAIAFLPPGAYTVTADLAGFERVAYTVVVDSGATVDLPFVMRVGRCLSSPIAVVRPFRDALREATLIAHVRIAATSTERDCRHADWCVCTEHVATVRRVVNAGRSLTGAATVTFLQTQSHREEANGDGAIFQPGQEFVAFLEWDDQLRSFRTYNHPSAYMFPVRESRVRSSRTDVPGFRDGMPVDQFIEIVDGMLRSR